MLWCPRAELWCPKLFPIKIAIVHSFWCLCRGVACPLLPALHVLDRFVVFVQKWVSIANPRSLERLLEANATLDLKVPVRPPPVVGVVVTCLSSRAEGLEILSRHAVRFSPSCPLPAGVPCLHEGSQVVCGTCVGFDPCVSRVGAGDEVVSVSARGVGVAPTCVSAVVEVADEGVEGVVDGDKALGVDPAGDDPVRVPAVDVVGVVVPGPADVIAEEDGVVAPAAVGEEARDVPAADDGVGDFGAQDEDEMELLSLLFRYMTVDDPFDEDTHMREPADWRFVEPRDDMEVDDDLLSVMSVHLDSSPFVYDDDNDDPIDIDMPSPVIPSQPATPPTSPPPSPTPVPMEVDTTIIAPTITTTASTTTITNTVTTTMPSTMPTPIPATTITNTAPITTPSTAAVATSPPLSPPLNPVMSLIQARIQRIRQAALTPTTPSNSATPTATATMPTTNAAIPTSSHSRINPDMPPPPPRPRRTILTTTPTTSSTSTATSTPSSSRIVRPDMPPPPPRPPRATATPSSSSSFRQSSSSSSSNTANSSTPRESAQLQQPATTATTTATSTPSLSSDVRDAQEALGLFD
ncbi:hypothetical protein O0I10_011992 [Lichtheimia ornata]|uniref:Uncharacterized protein n=1 Tax=Lichtheimia ornata TaxID=688661 RepID=A0AAD7XS27_9FUNG|nr:uncharacterized protein O0I10_011992 [Lichtheimia ornata]KAJ8652370.1 hypothetical protein O0I10_011992 [Lichtheimia ornata]